MYKCTQCNNQSKKEHIVCPRCRSVGMYVPCETSKKSYSIPKFSKKKLEEMAVNKDVKSELDIWFDKTRKHELEQGKCLCENCGCSVSNQLNSKDTWVWRGTIAHILPKKKYHSVATNDNNFLILCLQCHAEYDTSWKSMIGLQVLERAKEKLKLFIHLVTESTTKLPKELLN